MFDKLKMLQQANQMQKQMQGIIINHEEKGLKITINGKQEVLAVEIIDESLLEKKSNLEYSVKECLNSAIKKIQKETATQMQSQLGGLF